MPRLDVDLTTYLNSFDGLLRAQKVVSVFQQLIGSLEIVHDSKVIFNDLKPDNIMVNRKTGEVTLIDFGFASTYENADGTHISDSEMTSTFQGNINYASYDQMNFFKTGRKDDMIACFYILI